MAGAVSEAGSMFSRPSYQVCVAGVSKYPSTCPACVCASASTRVTGCPVGGSTMGKDIIQLIIEDHNRGREMYRQYTSPHTNAQQKQLLAWHMIRESSVHTVKEEQVLYPAMRRLMGDMAPDDCLDAHQTLKHKLARLADTPISDPGHDALLQDYMKSLLDHMLHEEEELLPQFMAAEGVSPEYLMQLGRVFESAKLIAPSRPYPWAANKLPLNLVFRAAITPVDFVRDMVQFEAAPPL